MNRDAYIARLRGRIQYWQAEIDRKERTHQSACSERAFLHELEQQLAEELDLQNQIQQAGATS